MSSGLVCPFASLSLFLFFLQFSKIGKVMRHIHALSQVKVPRDDEYKFRERAKALVDKWHGIINANKSNGSPTAGDAKAEGGSVATNGTSNGNGKAEEGGVNGNGKDASAEPVGAKTNGDDRVHAHAMDVEGDADADAKAEEMDLAGHEETSVPAALVAASATNEDALGENADADTSALADITMSEVAA